MEYMRRSRMAIDDMAISERPGPDNGVVSGISVAINGAHLAVATAPRGSWSSNSAVPAAMSRCAPTCVYASAADVPPLRFQSWEGESFAPSSLKAADRARRYHLVVWAVPKAWCD